MTASIPTEPRPIQRLKESLINKIAAGEIIHRPASALKELLENSLDAGATSIRVAVKEGGMKVLQIQDNGCGIRKDDLPILAERFTTSKLSTFSDLQKLTTYGFRGEALASMSHVAHLTVVTKTKKDTCAWKASYIDGVLSDLKTRQKAEPRPCAGNDGTTITIENLFYNVPTRLSALRSPSEEYSKILDVMTKYAVHNPKIAFVCKKEGSSAPELTTPSCADSAMSIRLLYGHSLAKELIHAKLGSSKSAPQPEGDDDRMDEDEPEKNKKETSWSAETYFSNANYQAKKTVFLLFINHRLVESSRMKRAFEAAYQSILPKGACPFIYLSLEIDPRSVDVNVHPTKKEVHFLDEEHITERIADTIQQNLSKQNHSRTFEYQTLLTGGILGDKSTLSKKRSRAERDDEPEEIEDEEGEEEIDKEPTQTQGKEGPKKVYSHYKVRTNVQDRTLDSMFPVASQSTQRPSKTDAPATTSSPSVAAKPKEIAESQCFLTSVKNLRQQIVKGKHRQLTEILEKHTFVGIADMMRCLSLIQYSTKLYLVNHDTLAEELFYQLGVRQFGNFSRIKLEPSPSLRELLEIGVAAEDSTSQSELSKPEIVEQIFKILLDRREMLLEYFSLDITEEGDIKSLPLLLQGYIPNLDNLPNFLMRLGPQVDWSSEIDCFDTFLRELAYFYTPIPSPPEDASVDPNDRNSYAAERWQIQHILFPAMRRYLVAPKSLLDRDVIQIADLPDLYKVFERC
ncbi:DNA mismatch repair protein MutL [Panaeolus papilionaceus]|nr:DNA mismatch repair protein MutL [Panaeolus papilionaceus]